MRTRLRPTDAGHHDVREQKSSQGTQAGEEVAARQSGERNADAEPDAALDLPLRGVEEVPELDVVKRRRRESQVHFEIAQGVLGGPFSSRLNMNLREDKHWSYGVRSGVANAVGPRVWATTTAVQIDKTAESLKELRREIVEYVTAKTPAKP